MNVTGCRRSDSIRSLAQLERAPAKTDSEARVRLLRRMGRAVRVSVGQNAQPLPCLLRRMRVESVSGNTPGRCPVGVRPRREPPMAAEAAAAAAAAVAA
eukprot:CAMPEP_0172178570 /NCGR_PEP_ID=MMETSP1050-20130122/16115_1 /TAXON_ID=233186 /ORGANISM="Cryptomonas curvata, Strain CCAP979/52" /LENGTH=98 /DNA_ID=CAMNT_0012851315 /DNA_START=167 /DNA_END=460 /DNA_ORIENTATION=-